LLPCRNDDFNFAVYTELKKKLKINHKTGGLV